MLLKAFSHISKMCFNAGSSKFLTPSFALEIKTDFICRRFLSFFKLTHIDCQTFSDSAFLNFSLLPWASFCAISFFAIWLSLSSCFFLVPLALAQGVQESLLGKLFMAAISSRSIHSGYHILISLKSNLFLENSHSAYISLKCLINVNSIVCKHLSVSLPSAWVIRVWDSKQDLVDSCLEETGGLGVDIIIDSGGLALLYITVVL